MGVTATTLDVSIVTVNHALTTTANIFVHTTSPSALAPAPVSVTSIVFITPSA